MPDLARENATLNTVKLYEAMTGGEPDAKARAFVNELDEQLTEKAVGKSDLAATEARLMAAITDVRGDTKALKWPVYAGAAGVIALVLRAFAPYPIP